MRNTYLIQSLALFTSDLENQTRSWLCHLLEPNSTAASGTNQSLGGLQYIGLGKKYSCNEP